MGRSAWLTSWRGRLGAVTLVLATALGLVLRDELPRWRAGGAAPMQTVPLPRTGAQMDCPKAGSRIAIYGDSHVVGSGGPTGVVPFGTIMQDALPGRVTVVLRGAGGQTAVMGERRWQNAPDDAETVILAYGTNDAAPRGWLRAKRPVETARFTASLRRQVEIWRDRGRTVTLLAPPPAASPAMMARIAPYREAVAGLGDARGIPVFDPAEAFNACEGEGPLLAYDGLHMTAAGHRCLGRWLAARLCPDTP